MKMGMFKLFRNLTRVLSFLLIFSITLLPITVHADSDADNAESVYRQINLVYDNSGSMYGDGANGELDTWCQAKYSMEVFASMLGENDVLSIYYMSDYRFDTSKGPQIVLYGSDGAATNISVIHNHTCKSGYTPFNAVRRAYSDLASSQAEEKWLVVLTDGAFNDFAEDVATQEMDNFFDQKSKDIKVMYLGMGEGAKPITNKPNSNIFYEHAETNDQILDKITHICTRIFDISKLTVDSSTGRFTLDVPMSELTVFAQGGDVSINGIRGETTVNSVDPLEVKYSECDDPSRHNQPTRELLGQIESFEADFGVGDYTVDVSGAKTLEIYYKPNVEIAVYLTDAEGNEVTNSENLEAGDYTVNYGFVKTGTDEKVGNSALLGDVNFEAVIENNGNLLGTFTDGGTISVEEGSLSIDATARYMDYHTVTTRLDYDVYKNKIVEFVVVNDPEFALGKNGFLDNEAYIEIKATVDGREFSDDEWNNFELPSIRLEQVERKFSIGDPRIEKGEMIGELRIYPVLPNGKPSTGSRYEDCTYIIECNQTYGIESWKGDYSGTLSIDDQRSYIDIHTGFIPTVISISAFMFLLLCELFKKRLPKMCDYPAVNMKPKRAGKRRTSLKARFKKKTSSVIWPFGPEKGTIKLPSGGPLIKVVAVGNRYMKIENLKSLQSRTNLSIDGTRISDIGKDETFSGNMEIVYEDKDYKYSCVPSQNE